MWLSLLTTGMHQLHLRRVGVEAQPDLIQVAPRGGSDGRQRPSNGKDGGEDTDDPPKDGASSSTDTKDHLPPASDAESNDLDEQILNSAKTCVVDSGYLTFPLFSCPLVAEKKHTIIDIDTLLYHVQLLAILSLLPLCLGVLYTIRKPLLMV